MTAHAFIFARGGSKGIPRKNLTLLDGKPLLLYSIELARQIDAVDKCYVSTDDDEIAKMALDNGAEVIERPKELADDRSPEWAAWQHAVTYLDHLNLSFDTFVSLPTTAPLRVLSDVKVL